MPQMLILILALLVPLRAATVPQSLIVRLSLKVAAARSRRPIGGALAPFCLSCCLGALIIRASISFHISELMADFLLYHRFDFKCTNTRIPPFFDSNRAELYRLIREMPVRRAIDDALARPPFAANDAHISSLSPAPPPPPESSPSTIESTSCVGRTCVRGGEDGCAEDEEGHSDKYGASNVHAMFSMPLRTRPSDAALDLIERLMEKDPNQRYISCFVFVLFKSIAHL
jgi:hypothetical protein